MASKAEPTIPEWMEILLRRIRELRADSRLTSEDRARIDAADTQFAAIFSAHTPLVPRTKVSPTHCRERCHCWSNAAHERSNDGCMAWVCEPHRKPFCVWSADELAKKSAPGKRYWKEPTEGAKK